MIDTILVPVDVSTPENASKSLDLAGPIAKAHGSKMVLLYVVEPVPGYVAAQLPPDIQDKASATSMDVMKQIAKDKGLPDTTEMLIRVGHPSSQILSCAEDAGADMIVIASHDPGLADYLIGSVAARVVRHAHCSVLVAR